MKHEHIKLTTCVKGTLLARSLIIESQWTDSRQPTWGFLTFLWSEWVSERGERRRSQNPIWVISGTPGALVKGQTQLQNDTTTRRLSAGQWGMVPQQWVHCCSCNNCCTGGWRMRPTWRFVGSTLCNRWEVEVMIQQSGARTDFLDLFVRF